MKLVLTMCPHASMIALLTPMPEILIGFVLLIARVDCMVTLSRVNAMPTHLNVLMVTMLILLIIYVFCQQIARLLELITSVKIRLKPVCRNVMNLTMETVPHGHVRPNAIQPSMVKIQLDCVYRDAQLIVPSHKVRIIYVWPGVLIFPSVILLIRSITYVLRPSTVQLVQLLVMLKIHQDHAWPHALPMNGLMQIPKDVYKFVLTDIMLMIQQEITYVLLVVQARTDLEIILQ